MFRPWPALAFSIVFPMSGERVQPVVITPKPLTSSHFLRSSIWVDLPTPSVPSITMSFPVRSARLWYGIPSPKKLILLPDIYCLRSLQKRRGPELFEPLAHDITHHGLLFFYRQGSVNDGQSIFLSQPFVFFEYPALKKNEALFPVFAQAEVHPSLMELQGRPSAQYPLQRNIHRDIEVEGDVRPDGEPVKIPDPFRVHAPYHVPAEGRIDVPVREDDHPCLERRNDKMREPVTKVSRVKYAEGGWRQQILLFPPFDGVVYERGRIPFGEEHLVSRVYEPLLQQLKLRRFPGTVYPFHYYEFSRIGMGSIE